MISKLLPWISFISKTQKSRLYKLQSNYQTKTQLKTFNIISCLCPLSVSQLSSRLLPPSAWPPLGPSRESRWRTCSSSSSLGSGDWRQAGEDPPRDQPLWSSACQTPWAAQASPPCQKWPLWWGEGWRSWRAYSWEAWSTLTTLRGKGLK